MSGPAFDEAVERMCQERSRHSLIGWNDCRCMDTSWVLPFPMVQGDGAERVAAWERHVEAAVLRALLSDSVPCETCGIGTVYGVQPDGQIKCPDCTDGQVSRPSLAVLRAHLELVTVDRDAILVDVDGVELADQGVPVYVERIASGEVAP